MNVMHSHSASKGADVGVCLDWFLPSCSIDTSLVVVRLGGRSLRPKGSVCGAKNGRVLSPSGSKRRNMLEIRYTVL